MPLQITGGRARTASVATLYEQFQMYGLTTEVSYEEYARTVDAPMTRRVLKKLFMGRWPRAMATLRKQFPDVDVVVNKIPKKVSKPAPKAETKPAPKTVKSESKPAPKAEKKSED